MKDDVYTSVHLEEFLESGTIYYKSLAQEITRIAKREEAPYIFDEMGIIRTVLRLLATFFAGKVTPKVKDLQAEERLLHAIFGDKSRRYVISPCTSR